MNKVGAVFNVEKSIKICLIGGFHVTNFYGEEISLRAIKARCILILLALSKEGKIPRDDVAQLLWSRHAKEQARTSLRQSIRVLRQAFKPIDSELLRADREYLYLQLDNVWVDVNEAVAIASRLTHQMDRLPALCTGLVLNDIKSNDKKFEAWVAEKREALTHTLSLSLENALRISIEKNISEATGNEKLIADIAHCLARIQPANEIASRALIYCYAKKNNYIAAITQYHTLKQHLHTTHGTQPSTLTARFLIEIQNKRVPVLNRVIPSEEECKSKHTESTGNDHELIKKRERDATDLTFKAHHYTSFQHDITSDSPVWHYRKGLLDKVQHFWIEGILQSALENSTLVELGLKKETDQLYQPWLNIIQHPKQTCGSSLVNTKIVDVFQALGQNLLILGAPGAGKTTLLLHLAQQLLTRSRDDKTQAIPIVFHLSTWTTKSDNFRFWLEEELETRYQIPRKISANLIQRGILILLLDGLDEVNPKCRALCIEAINQFRKNNIQINVVVCCREEDYKNHTKKLALSGAVSIQSISAQQLFSYADAIEGKVPGFALAIKNNPQLCELLSTPLILNIVVSTWKSQTTAADIHPVSMNENIDDIYSLYTRTMLEKRRSTDQYSEAETTKWLGWLASALIKNNQSIFYLDEIQPKWLTSKKQRWLVSKGSVLICSYLSALFLGLLSGFFNHNTHHMMFILILATVGGYVTGAFGYGDEIKVVSKIRLSAKVLKQQGRLRLFFSTLPPLMFGSGVALAVNVKTGTIIALFFFIFMLIINAWDRESKSNQQHVFAMPNDGIKHSIKNWLISTLLGFSVGCLIGLTYATYTHAIYVGLLLGLLSGLFFGGHTCIQHYMLRFFLWRNKEAPLNYIHFLNFATERIFLYRVGGGYIFAHQTMADYFSTKFGTHKG